MIKVICDLCCKEVPAVESVVKVYFDDENSAKDICINCLVHGAQARDHRIRMFEHFSTLISKVEKKKSKPKINHLNRRN